MTATAAGLQPRPGGPGAKNVIRTPDQRLRIFVSSTLRELAAERQAVRNAVTRLRLVPVMFELAAPGRTRRGRSTMPTWRKARFSLACTGRVTAWSHQARTSPR